MEEKIVFPNPKSSWCVSIICSCLLITTVLASLVWLLIVAMQHGIYAMVFITFIAPCLGLGSLFFGVIPSTILFIRHHRSLDRISLRLSVASLIAIIVESALLFYVPLHGC